MAFAVAVALTVAASVARFFPELTPGRGRALGCSSRCWPCRWALYASRKYFLDRGSLAESLVAGSLGAFIFFLVTGSLLTRFAERGAGT